MTPEEFISCIRHEVLEDSLTMYREHLDRSLSGTEKVYWPRMAEFYRSLSDEQRQQFLEAIRQVMVDTLSNVMGILDGSTLLEQHRDFFHLTYGNERQELNGDLQDLFLSSEG
jgi:hypothetical protein